MSNRNSSQETFLKKYAPLYDERSNNSLKIQRNTKSIQNNDSFIKEIQDSTKTQPDSTPFYSKEERMWKHHQWISRKRNKYGKWIYDYGMGYGKGNPKLVQKLKDENKSLAEESGHLVKENQLLDRQMQDLVDSDKTDFDRLVEAGRNYINGLFK